MTFRIREVDGVEFADDLALLHDETFPMGAAPECDTTDGHWWLVYPAGLPYPVAFAGVIPSDRYFNTGYYKRVGVLPMWRGRGLQLRLTRAIESRCRKNGWISVVSDTTDNIPSANNFIRAGYRLFAPAAPWSFEGALYWRKDL